MTTPSAADRNQDYWLDFTQAMTPDQKDIIRACMVGAMMNLVSPEEFAKACQQAKAYLHPEEVKA